MKRTDTPEQTAAAACRSDPAGVDIFCVRDKVMQINGNDVSKDDFEDGMQMIIDDGPEEVKLVLGRPSNAVAVRRWNNGITVVAKVGDSFGSIAQ
eukprot:CAMPEP_0201878662 /NCGR_PEP_ID=MMETSP0902-20130614/9768_1 /ASSEMBLY_ACC=CAM_ASM_000551 /TAXON_ID=420261 /ORGANISM="Thalassiosira antarctica, Strain CCMP982" /LENGTH=94 /DNA_ID=CAMNT_0048406341 /DNA_START=484 /DNA_END=769 /DNA_ORIENTATION=+